MTHRVRWGGGSAPREKKKIRETDPAKICTCLFMIHQEAAPSRDFASYLITWVTCFSEVSFLQNSVCDFTQVQEQLLVILVRSIAAQLTGSYNTV